jgi:NitT/TauT family transport system permease protein
VVLGIVVLLYGVSKAGWMLLAVPLGQWGLIGAGVFSTLLRVVAALIIALVWTIPVGVAIGTNRKLADWLEPLVQISASIPATALFPIVLLYMLHLPGGINMAAILLMLMGTQWYLLFNIIAGASAIPQDLKYTAQLIGLSRVDRWKTLILPSLFPYIVTGAITASGGAWNASIVAEYTQFGGQVHQTFGVGALIADATAAGNFPLLLSATLTMILAVIATNRLVWRRLYRLAEKRYKME